MEEKEELLADATAAAQAAQELLRRSVDNMRSFVLSFQNESAASKAIVKDLPPRLEIAGWLGNSESEGDG